MKDKLLDDTSAAGVARGVLLLSQANYFAARAVIQLAGSGSAQLGVNGPPKGFLKKARKGKVPSWTEMVEHLPQAAESLKSIPDRIGPAVLSNHREAVIDSIAKYVDCARKVTPLRDAICHGVLTKDENFDTVLHPTDGNESFVLRKEVPKFVQLSQNAYAAATSVDFCLLQLRFFVNAI